MSTDSTVAARIPADLRADLERIAELNPLERNRDGLPTLTPHLRRALRQYADRELRNGTAALNGSVGLFAPAEGASHRDDPATSRAAARDTAPRTGTARRRTLEYIVRRGARGATADELLEQEERNGHRPAGNGPARRVSELKAARAIEPLRAPHVPYPLVTRKTRSGSDATVYVATDKGRQWLREAGR